MSLLIIDDDPVHRMVIKRVAERAGLRVEVAPTAEEAADKLSKGRYRWVTLDLNLGCEQGVHLVRNIAAMKPRPLVLVVSSSEASVRQFVVDVGAQYDMRLMDMSKPIDLKILRETFLIPPSTSVGWTSAATPGSSPPHFG
jgi:CheY-like chemotaxis protein